MHAEACSYQATLPQNADKKDRLLKLANQWAEMAAKADKDRARICRPSGDPGRATPYRQLTSQG